MKTRHFLVVGFLAISSQFINAQATSANSTNTVTATAYLGSGASSNFDVQFKRNNVPAGKLATTFTNFGVNSLAMPNSVSIGVGAGKSSSGTGFNTNIGNFAGANSPGNNNIHIGYESGNSDDGDKNIFIGNSSGPDDGTCGDNNIFIGHGAGYSVYDSNNLLFIENSFSTTPLIWGDFALNQLKFNSKVGVGYGFGNYPTTSGTVNVSNYNLFVKGGILTEEVRVSLQSTWADYVFAKDYKLPTLNEVENHVKEKGHLINVPSAKEVKENGIELGEMAKIQQEKIEELTLYIIELNKKLEAQEKRMQALEAKINN